MDLYRSQLDAELWLSGILADKTLIGTFTANLETLPGAEADPRTTEWWRTQPAAWEASRENPQSPAVVMPQYVAWLKELPGPPVFVGYPAVFDFMFVYWYLMRFAGENPFSYSALDIKTYAMAMLRKGYRETVKRNMPKNGSIRYRTRTARSKTPSNRAPFSATSSLQIEGQVVRALAGISGGRSPINEAVRLYIKTLATQNPRRRPREGEVGTTCRQIEGRNRLSKHRSDP